jgi:hypothetical protein
MYVVSLLIHSQCYQIAHHPVVLYTDTCSVISVTNSHIVL